MRVKVCWLLGLYTGMAVFLAASASASIQIPKKMNYQGYLTDGSGQPINGTRNLRFRLYDAAGNMMNWVETHQNVSIVNGIFNVVLGGSTAPAANSVNETFREPYQLEIQVYHPPSGPWESMSPRHLLTNAAYAMAARKVVYQQVLTVAADGGDTTTVSGAIDMLMGTGAFAGAAYGPMSPAPSVSTPWVIEVKAGRYQEPGTQYGGFSGAINIPDWVTVRGQGWDATELQVSRINLAGAGRALESLMITGRDTGVILIAMNGSQNCYVRECRIEVQDPVLTIDMSNAQNCDAVENYLAIMGPGSCGGIGVAGVNDCRVEDNVVNLNYNLAAGPVSFGISDQGVPMPEGYILENTVQYRNTMAWPACVYGIGLTIGGQGRVSYNVFRNEASASPINLDIVDLATGTAPAAAFTPDGICNQDSAGAQIPSF